ncbi:LLM class F420-dependent oxidoreductase [Jatrophihabitans sp.]|uniref:LLM class F420-dependent oxidoreductase n=1 Tax=Jatrophihabitans sp. TaxID=1932789 RepID=UPI0030C6ECA0|nr:luciferase family protein [Jatrophihabitans sp.]
MTRRPQFGVVFPQNEIDPAGVHTLAFGRGVEELGFRHVAAFDHVVGADTATRPDWNGHYDVDDEFHEPLVLFAYLAAATELEFTSAVIILPQRQTVLVAKQAATLDQLSGGRLRLGVGIGWNEVEYEALGVPYAGRAERLEDQIALLRRLWTTRTVTWNSAYNSIDRAGIAPLPAQRPIPIWFGTWARAAAPLRRIGELADGWMPTSIDPGPELKAAKQVVDRAAEAAGRDPATIGFEGRITVGRGLDPYGVPAVVDEWISLGATHITIDTRRSRRRNAEHLDLLAQVAIALEL